MYFVIFVNYFTILNNKLVKTNTGHENIVNFTLLCQNSVFDSKVKSPIADLVTFWSPNITAS